MRSELERSLRTSGSVLYCFLLKVLLTCARAARLTGISGAKQTLEYEFILRRKCNSSNVSNKQNCDCFGLFLILED